MSITKTASAATMLLLAAFMLTACGRKGPLYMQQAPAKPAPAAIAPTELKPGSPELSIQSQPVPTQTESQKKP